MTKVTHFFRLNSLSVESNIHKNQIKNFSNKKKINNYMQGAENVKEVKYKTKS